MSSADHQIPELSEIDDPNTLVEAWQAIRADVLAVLAGVAAKDFRTKPQDGSWSAAQIAEHLYLTQNFFARAAPAVLRGRIGHAIETRNPLNPEIGRQTERPQGIKNPEAVTPENAWEKGDHEEPLATAMTRTAKAFSDRSRAELEKRGLDHEIFGRIDLLQFLWVLTRHEKSHLKALEAKFGN